jgi:hypothetical protein
MTDENNLFRRIIGRLGLEKQLKAVEKNLGVFSALLGIFIFLSVFAFIGLKQVLSETGIGFYISLAFSDPGPVIKNFDSFSYSVFETIPGASIFLFLLALGFMLLFIKYFVYFSEKLLNIIKSIKKIKHE